jgi:hypothetical protein
MPRAVVADAEVINVKFMISTTFMFKCLLLKSCKFCIVFL